MTKSVTKVQDKDTNKRLSVVRSKDDPTKYGVVILNPDGSKIRGPKGDKGDAATITVGSTTTGAPGTDACVINSGTTSDAILDFTIPEGEKGDRGETGNGISCVTSTKVGKETTVTMDFTDACCAPFSFTVEDGLDASGDVEGPDSSTDGHIAVFDGNTGKLIKDGGALATVATSGEYCDLSGTPSIGDGLVTICRNSVCVNSFTLNQSSCSGIDISVPVNTSDLCNDSGYIDNTVNNLQNYTLSSNLCTVATSGKYCDLSGTPALCTVATSGKYCDLSGLPTIPTDNCQLANGCGYTTCTGTVVASDLTPYAKTCDLATVATSGQYCDLTGTPSLATVATSGKYCDLSGTPSLCTVATSGNYCDLIGTPSLCTVATSGKYCDLTGQPTIPTDNCQLANGCGYTTCTGTLVASDLTPYAKSCDLAAVATSGCYCDLSGTPTIPAVVNSLSCSCTNKSLSAKQGCVLNSCITDINGKIPSEASSSNQLADKCFVNSSINSVAAYYITKNANGDQFATYAELSAATTFYSGGVVRVPTRNDYTIVASDENHDNATTRYIYNTTWEYQYTINETPLTQAQLDALNSGITSSKVSCYDSAVCTVNSLCAVATSGQYCDLTGTPDLSCYQTTSCMVCNLSGADNSHYPSAKAVADALSCAGAGDMLASVYDPCNKCSNAFDYCNFINTPTIPTDNCQLANGCGYTTCTGTVVASDLNAYAKSCTLCTVATSGKYCDLTGTPTIPAAQIQSDWGQTCNTCKDYIKNKPNLCTVATSAKYCDLTGTPTIPTDNCQLSNGCGYTTCTGTLVASDLTPYAKSCTLCTVATTGKYCDLTGQPTIGSASLSICRNGTLVNSFSANATSNVSVDISVPTDTCELINGAGFTTCTGTLTSSNISDAAYASSWNGVTTTAPSKNAVYDKISSMDTTISGKQATLVSGTNIKTINNESILGSGNLTITGGGTYYAGDGIEITEHSDMQGPCPSGFHIPTSTEWTAVKTVWTTLGGGSSDGTNFGIALKLPFAGYRLNSTSGTGSQGNNGYYWSSIRSSKNYSARLSFSSSSISTNNTSYCANGCSVRGFKNSPVVPDGTWTTLKSGTGSAGIFRSSTLGLISMSSDGTTWITIADKNVGATTVWNSGDTLSEANCGKYFQRGNNYGFDWTGTIANQSTTQVDASGYGPGNYYSSSTFIKYGGSWDSSDNANLWGGSSQGTYKLVTNTAMASDYQWKTKSGSSITLDLRNIMTPTQNFTVNLPSTLAEGEEYVLRLVNDTAYTMTLGTGFTNPRNVDLTLSGGASDQFVFLAINGGLELQPLFTPAS